MASAFNFLLGYTVHLQDIKLYIYSQIYLILRPILWNNQPVKGELYPKPKFIMFCVTIAPKSG